VANDNVHSLGEVVQWADAAMYRAEPIPGAAGAEGDLAPRVTLLSMNTDPLGDIAAGAMMYEGRVCRSLGDVTEEERRHYFGEIAKTHLKAPYELVQMHFLLEGVTRSFTHQLVRQRTAVYMQESLRFAVKEHVDEEVALPPSLRRLADDHPQRRLWQQAVNKIDDTYHALIGSGIPAEDARGLLPHNITTRVHYSTNLRALLDHAGNRLCTQAQFEWRAVFTGIAQAIRNYRPAGDFYADGREAWSWQYGALADLLRPVCYQVGHCVFQADFDRSCSIRNRVQANAEVGRQSGEWDTELDVVVGVGPKSVVRDESDRPVFIGAIQPAEWLADPGAAR
jgi:flavin-dependent thymidylate synthase